MSNIHEQVVPYDAFYQKHGGASSPGTEPPADGVYQSEYGGTTNYVVISVSQAPEKPLGTLQIWPVRPNQLEQGLALGQQVFEAIQSGKTDDDPVMVELKKQLGSLSAV